MNVLTDYKWGGLARRYVDFPRGCFRCIDPVDMTRVSFRTPLHYENWLLRRFDPSVNQIAIDTKISAGPQDQEVIAIPDLDIHFADGSRIFDSVSLNKTCNPRVVSLRKVAAYVNCAVSLRSQTEIRRDPRLIQSLRHLRQAMVAHRGSSKSVARLVAKFLSSKTETTLREIRTALPDFADDEIDAALGYMHIARFIHLRLDGIQYGCQLVVRNV